MRSESAGHSRRFRFTFEPVHNLFTIFTHKVL